MYKFNKSNLDWYVGLRMDMLNYSTKHNIRAQKTDPDLHNGFVAATFRAFWATIVYHPTIERTVYCRA